MKIKVGAREYKIIKERFSNENQEEIMGYVDYHQSKIIINNNLSFDAEEEVLIHEILHTIIDKNNVELLARKSNINEFVENIVEYLTPRMHSFLIDNPDFLKRFIKS